MLTSLDYWTKVTNNISISYEENNLYLLFVSYFTWSYNKRVVYTFYDVHNIFI